MHSKNALNHEKGKCTSVFKWKGIALKEFDFGIFQYFFNDVFITPVLLLLDTLRTSIKLKNKNFKFFNFYPTAIPLAYPEAGQG